LVRLRRESRLGAGLFVHEDNWSLWTDVDLSRVLLVGALLPEREGRISVGNQHEIFQLDSELIGKELLNLDSRLTDHS
jgi:hypothetical protein